MRPQVNIARMVMVTLTMVTMKMKMMIVNIQMKMDFRCRELLCGGRIPEADSSLLAGS